MFLPCCFAKREIAKECLARVSIFDNNFYQIERRQCLWKENKIEIIKAVGGHF